MHLGQPRRAARVAPQCNIPPIIIRHPNYAYHESALLSFPPLDSVTDHDETDGPKAAWGVHYSTVKTACQIIAGNNPLVYLSHEAAGGHPARIGLDGLLTFPEYWLQAAASESQLMEIGQKHSGCILSGSLTKANAHLVPRAMSSWFRYNNMGNYVSDYRPHLSTCNLENMQQLRGDFLKDFDERAFAIVPKLTRDGYRLVAHYVSAADDLSCPANIFHNQMSQQVQRIPIELLYAHFAYTIFGLLEPRNMSPAEATARQTRLSRNAVSKKRTMIQAGIPSLVQTNLKQESGSDEWARRLAETRARLTASAQALPHPAGGRVGRATFSHLPLEVRLKVWESTWTPERRVIEVVIARRHKPDGDVVEDSEDEEHDKGGRGPVSGGDFEYVRLQSASSLSKWLRKHTERCEWKDLYDQRTVLAAYHKLPRAVNCPIALAVCAEPRHHTLESFCRMYDYRRQRCSFYFHRTRDIVWLSGDLTELE
ncbi:hypothetical protein FDECE_15207 [Fusarium decemcellulare]|nr:hypothetical protein FDECE_15207 [Fusarium decemcellulare]